MAVPSLIELAESGAHFGHHRSLTYPKAKEFVFTIKNNVALINLEQTQAAIEQAQKIISQYKKENKQILLVGTKRSVRNLIKEMAETIDAAYINERWFGGTLTNFTTIKDNIKRMHDLENFLSSVKASKLSKKERLVFERRLNRYHRFLLGLSNLKNTPDLIILASANEDSVAINEANQLGIPVMAIMDTDMNPDRISYPIPANDDAPKAVEIILRAIVAAPAEKKSAVKEEIIEETVTEEPVEEKAVKKPRAKKTEAKEEKTEKSAKKEPAVKTKKASTSKTTKKVKNEEA